MGLSDMAKNAPNEVCADQLIGVLMDALKGESEEDKKEILTTISYTIRTVLGFMK